MKGKKQVHSHERDDWTTPPDLFEELDKEFNFTLDVAADAHNSCCSDFISEDVNALTFEPWGYGDEVVWCNPPYSKWQKFVAKADEQFRRRKNIVIVMLLAARTDTRAFHDYLYLKPHVEIRFIRGRLKFGGSKTGAPFPSMLAIWRRK